MLRRDLSTSGRLRQRAGKRGFQRAHGIVFIPGQVHAQAKAVTCSAWLHQQRRHLVAQLIGGWRQTFAQREDQCAQQQRGHTAGEVLQHAIECFLQFI